MIEYDSNPTKRQEIEKYTNEVKNGMHPNLLSQVLLTEIVEIIAKQTNESAIEVKERIYMKAGELMVNSICYGYPLRDE